MHVLFPVDGCEEFLGCWEYVGGYVFIYLKLTRVILPPQWPPLLTGLCAGVGVSAYLGAAAKIMNSTYLSEAGSILSVEARHSAYLRAAQGEVPYPQPFDNPLDFNEVYTIASPFIASCPSNNTKLPVKAFPSLMMMASDGGMMSAMPGSKVHLMAGEGFEKMMASDVHAAFITATGPMWAPVEDKGDGKFMVTVPMGVSGQSYVVLTRGNTQATDDNIVAGPAIIEVCNSTLSPFSLGRVFENGC